MTGELEHGRLSPEDYEKAPRKEGSELAGRSCGLQILKNDVSQMYPQISPISMILTLIMRTPLPGY